MPLKTYLPRCLSSVSMIVWRFWGRARNRTFSMIAAPRFFEFGRGSLIQLPLALWGEKHISIGSQVHVGSGSWLIVLGDATAGDSAVIRIGDGCRISGEVTITALRSVRIGNRVLIGRGVHISDHSHRFEKTGVAIMDQGLTEPYPVLIGDGSWLGQGVVVCPGVRIGANCVVGANSVVKSDIPDNSLAAGCPARVVRGIS